MDCLSPNHLLHDMIYYTTVAKHDQRKQQLDIRVSLHHPHMLYCMNQASGQKVNQLNWPTYTTTIINITRRLAVQSNWSIPTYRVFTQTGVPTYL